MNIKTLILIALALICTTNNLQAQTIAKNDKILVTYFSLSGNTKQVAEQIHSLVGGDIFEIKTTNTYPENYKDTTKQAKQELKDNFRPALASHVTNMKEYDVIFVGFPIWWGTMPTPVFTFLEEYDFAGKTVIPFCTHGGGGASDSEDDLAKILPNTKRGEIFSINGKKASKSKEELEKWLKEFKPEQ